MEVDIGSETYVGYADQDTADLYVGAATHGATFRAATSDEKGRALVTATRILDRQVWRDGYTTFAEREVVQNIIDASIELAISLLDGTDVQNQQNTAERIRSMTAGSVSITNFRGIDNPTRFPQIVQELLRDYLGSSVAARDAVATGVDGESDFPVDLGYTVGGL